MAGVAITLLAIVAAAVSIYARRTRLEKTTEFWGKDTILALQLSPKVTMQLENPPPAPAAADQRSAGDSSGAANGAAVPVGPAEPKIIDLTGTPGLGHLRHALLDQRHYDWSTRTAASVRSLQSSATHFATLTFSDPSGHYPSASIELELTGGWAGRPDAADRVQLTPRAQPAVRHFLLLISNTQQAHYDNR